MQVYTVKIQNLIQLTGFKVTSTECFFSHHSLFLLITFKQHVVQHDATTKVICTPGTSYLQYVGDNTDHDIATLDGNNTNHGFGSIASASGKFRNLNTRLTPLLREKKQ